MHVGGSILVANNLIKSVWFSQGLQRAPFLTSAILCPVSYFSGRALGQGKGELTAGKAFEI